MILVVVYVNNSVHIHLKHPLQMGKYWLILKTSAVSSTEFQSSIFELSPRILSYGKKYSYQLEGTG